MHYIFGFLSILAATGLLIESEIHEKLLHEVKVEAFKKIDRGLSPMTPKVRKFNGGKSKLFQKLPEREIVSSLK